MTSIKEMKDRGYIFPPHPGLQPGDVIEVDDVKDIVVGDWRQDVVDWGPEAPVTSALPPDAATRKQIPIYSGVLKYFPKAIAAVAECSMVGNDQHNPGTELHWDRSKSGDELDALARHLLEVGTVDTDGIRHSTKVAWRALANLEKELEREDVN